MILIPLLIGSFLGLFPVSVRIADPLFTHPFHPEWPCGILLVWPDHIELRWVHSISEVLPRPKDASYTFNVAPNRQAWVEEQVRHAVTNNAGASWSIRVKQLGPGRQQIQLELWKDGFTGLVYEARADTILPLRSRRAGTLDSLVVLYVHLLFYAGLWFLVWLIRHLLVKSRQRAFAPAHLCLLT